MNDKILNNNYYGIPTTLWKNTAYYNNLLFYAKLPTALRDYYIRVVKSSLEWYDGFVCGFHDSDKGMVSTKYCRSLINGIARSVVGSRLLFQSKSGSVENKALNDIGKWAEKVDLYTKFESAVEVSYCGAKSCLKLNPDIKGDLWVEVVRQDCFYYMTDFKGEPIEAQFYLKTFTNSNNNNQYFLYEKRFFMISDGKQMFKKSFINENGERDYKVIIYPKGEKVPVVVYQMGSYHGTALINTFSGSGVKQDTDAFIGAVNNDLNNKKFAFGSKGNGLDYQQIPPNIQKAFKENYGDMELGVPHILPFEKMENKLGVYLIGNGKDMSLTTADVGYSLVNNLVAEFVAYDQNWTYLLRDVYLGKGTALVPKQFSAPTPQFDDTGHEIVQQGMGGVLDPFYFETYDSANPDTDRPTIFQNDMRITEHSANADNINKRVATKLGCSPKRIASWIQGSQSATASEVNADDDLDVAFIENQRINFEKSINDFLRDVCLQYGYEDYVKIKWFSPVALNKDRIQRRLVEQYQLGLIDEEFMLRNLYPDFDDTQIKNLVERAKVRQEKLQQEKTLFLDSQGNYGNENGNSDYVAELDQPDLQTPNAE